MKLYTTEMQVYDDGHRLLATVTAEDGCAIVKLSDEAHDVDSWNNLAATIRDALVEVCKE